MSQQQQQEQHLAAANKWIIFLLDRLHLTINYES